MPDRLGIGNTAFHAQTRCRLPQLGFRGSITQPTSSLCTLRTRGCPRPRNTRFRLSVYSTGRVWLPAGFHRKVSALHLPLTLPPFPGLAWRTPVPFSSSRWTLGQISAFLKAI